MPPHFDAGRSGGGARSPAGVTGAVAVAAQRPLLDRRVGRRRRCPHAACRLVRSRSVTPRRVRRSSRRRPPAGAAADRDRGSRPRGILSWSERTRRACARAALAGSFWRAGLAIGAFEGTEMKGGFMRYRRGEGKGCGCCTRKPRSGRCWMVLGARRDKAGFGAAASGVAWLQASQASERNSFRLFRGLDFTEFLSKHLWSADTLSYHRRRAHL